MDLAKFDLISNTKLVLFAYRTNDVSFILNHTQKKKIYRIRSVYYMRQNVKNFQQCSPLSTLKYKLIFCIFLLLFFFFNFIYPITIAKSNIRNNSFSSIMIVLLSFFTNEILNVLNYTNKCWYIIPWNLCALFSSISILPKKADCYFYLK